VTDVLLVRGTMASLSRAVFGRSRCRTSVPIFGGLLAVGLVLGAYLGLSTFGCLQNDNPSSSLRWVGESRPKDAQVPRAVPAGDILNQVIVLAQSTAAATPLAVNYPVPALAFSKLCKTPSLDWQALLDRTRWIIVIRGERHSGTSWARQLIRLNAPDTEYITSLYGHKHGDVTPEQAGRLKSYPRHIMMFLWRNVFTWLLKMYQDPYCVVYTGHKIGFRLETLKMRTDSTGLLFEKLRGVPSANPAMMEMETNYSYFLRRKHVMPNEFGKQSCTLGDSPSFMHVRNLRYRNWLAQMSIVGDQNTAGIQYEQIAAENGTHFFEILDKRGVPRNPTFDKAGTGVKFGKQGASALNSETVYINHSYKVIQVDEKSKLTFATPVDEYMSKYTLADIAYVLERLDPAVEYYAGYGQYEAERQWAAKRFGVEAAAKAWRTLGTKQFVREKRRH